MSLIRAYVRLRRSVGWARYGELFGYNADDKVLHLDTGQETAG